MAIIMGKGCIEAIPGILWPYGVEGHFPTCTVKATLKITKLSMKFVSRENLLRMLPVKRMVRND